MNTQHTHFASILVLCIFAVIEFSDIMMLFFFFCSLAPYVKLTYYLKYPTYLNLSNLLETFPSLVVLQCLH